MTAQFDGEGGVDTQQALKYRIVAALTMNGWDRVLETWWRCYGRNRNVDQECVDRSTGAYLDRMADDIAEALLGGPEDSRREELAEAGGLSCVPSVPERRGTSLPPGPKVRWIKRLVPEHTESGGDGILAAQNLSDCLPADPQSAGNLGGPHA